SWTIAVATMLAITLIKSAALFHSTGFYWDIWGMTNRALLASVLGPARIYDSGLSVDTYPPGSLYLLWLSGSIGRLIQPGAEGFRVIVESPSLIADFLIGLTIYFWSLRERRGWLPFIAMILFALNPGLVFDSVGWGQSDSIVALPLIVAMFLIVI